MDEPAADDPRVCDDDPRRAVGRGEARTRRGDGGLVGDVARDRDRAVADHRARVVEVLRSGSEERDDETTGVERARDREADSTRSAGDDRELSHGLA